MTYTFNDLPKYNKNGDEIEYTIDEEGTNSEFYQKTDVNQETRTITNTFKVPEETVTVKVTKNWVDFNNEAQKRPTNVTVQVKNGNQVGKNSTIKCRKQLDSRKLKYNTRSSVKRNKLRSR